MDERKAQIENMIVDAILLGIEKKLATEEDLPKIADYVLRYIEPITTEQDLLRFLDDLSLRWPIFENVRQIEKGTMRQFLERQMAQQALKLIQSGKFNEAVGVTSKITGGINNGNKLT